MSLHKEDYLAFATEHKQALIIAALMLFAFFAGYMLG